MESVSVLWHPEGKPVSVKALRTESGYYAKTAAGVWWRLSGLGVPPYAWMVPVVSIKRPDRIARYDALASA